MATRLLTAAVDPGGEGVEGCVEDLGLSLEVVGGAGQLDDLPGGDGDGVVHLAAEVRRNGGVGRGVEHEDRCLDGRQPAQRVGEGVVDGPLVDPRPQRRAPADPGGQQVRHLGPTPQRRADGAVAGIDRAVEHAEIGGGAMHDEGEVVEPLGPVAGGPDRGELLLGPRRDAAVAVHLGGPVAGYEVGAVRRAVGGVVHVEGRVAREGIVLVDDRRIEPLGAEPGPRRVGVEHGDAVGGREVGLGEVGAAAGWVGHRRVLGLRLVVGDDRRATGVAEGHHLVVTERAEVADHRPDVEKAVLHDQRRVVADVAGGEPDAGETTGGEPGQGVVAEEVRRRVADHRPRSSGGSRPPSPRCPTRCAPGGRRPSRPPPGRARPAARPRGCARARAPSRLHQLVRGGGGGRRGSSRGRGPASGGGGRRAPT